MEQKEKNDILVNGILFELEKKIITGRELLPLVGIHDSDDYEILMKLSEKEYEPVELNQEVDLGHPGIESFTIKPYHHFKIEIDDREKEVLEAFMTPVQIMGLLGYAEADYYLKEITGHKEITYKDNPKHPIAMKDCMKFSTCKKSPTGVS